MTDDVAEIARRAGERLIVKTDAIVEGRHYLSSDPADQVAKKLLRVNLSDLAGKGARPLGYVVAAAFPDGVSEAWIAAFARGLGEDQRRFAVSLLGGDTTATPGPATFALTVFGGVRGRLPRRGDARIGDEIWISGTLGDGALGLRVSKGEFPGLPPAAARALVERYRLPEPRLEFGRLVLPFARASMDVSDGLVADLDHICQASGVGARVLAEALPLSDAASVLLAEAPELFAEVVTGGDDYEVLFTAPASSAARIAAAARKAGVPATRIGYVGRGRSVRVLDRNGQAIEFGRRGYRHF